MTPDPFTPAERRRLRLSRWAAFLFAPAVPAVIAFSIIAVADKLGYHDRQAFDGLSFAANWCLAPCLAAAAIFVLHPSARARRGLAVAAAAAAVPTYWLAFAAVAIAGMLVGLDM